MHDPASVLTSHYDWLLGWARQLSRGTSVAAEDLVHDLYIRLIRMQAPPELPDDDGARAYLYTALKHIFTAQFHQRTRADSRSVNFDAISFQISSPNRDYLSYVRSDLAAVCEYACIRRKTSRAPVAFILRYFLGYKPIEVTAILHTRRNLVDTLCQTARLEARAYLERPDTLHFLRGEQRYKTHSRNLPEDSTALFAELKRRVFSDSDEGSCFRPGELEHCYSSTVSLFETSDLAHLSSCRTCFKRAMGILGFADLLSATGAAKQSGGAVAP